MLRSYSDSELRAVVGMPTVGSPTRYDHRARGTMKIRMTETARAENLKNGLIWGIGSFIVWSLLTMLPIICGLNTAEYPGLGSVVVWSVLLVIFGKWIYNQSIGGKVLLDCGTYPNKWWVCLAAIVFVLVVELYAAFAPRSTPNVLSWNLTLMVVLMAASMLIAGFGRLQVRENGIWDRVSLLPWGKIGSYSWAEDFTLLVSKKSWFSLRRAFPIPAEQKQAVDELLSRLCPVRPAAQ